MKLLGLMSGTSLDGIDVALLEVTEDASGPEGPSSPPIPRVAWRLLAFHDRPYTPEERDEIRGALAGGGPRELALLNTRLGEWSAMAVLDLLDREGEVPEGIGAIGSHGQTVWHEPPRAGRRGSSLQLGCPSTLAERTGIPVVSDFRARDLAAGGHGAPLVPWADAVLFSLPDASRAIQNLGGMGNVTWLPPGGDPGAILAFDTGPGVALLDVAAESATAGDWRFDRDGALARRGRVVEGVLSRLLALPFFQEEPPRSTGREVFGPHLVEEARAWLEAEIGRSLTPGVPGEGWPDLLATLTALTARSLGDAYRKWVLPRGVAEVFLMGGGARNPALREAIERELSPVPVRAGEDLGMNPDAREAAAFALLAWAHLMGLPANVPGATGSGGPRVLGSFTPGVRR
ncbi:MAG: anhydro-N-acetylmuramic acid kinase [Longimicrobiales bacterium]